MAGLKITGPFTAMVSNREVIKRASGLVTAADAVGQIVPGATIVGVTKGGFSLLDIIQHLMSVTGPAEVDISTWTAGVYDSDLLWQFAQDGSITKIRFLLDPAMFGTKPEWAKPFLAAFGGESIRAIENHAKFALVSGGDWRLTVTSSMNLNRNKRLENFVLFTDPAVWQFHREIVDQCFRQVPPYWRDARRSKAEYDTLMLPSMTAPKAGPLVW